MRNVYRIQSLEKELGVIFDKKWLSEQQSSGKLCGVCTRVMPSARNSTYDVVYRQVLDVHAAQTSVTGIGTIRKAILERIMKVCDARIPTGAAIHRDDGVRVEFSTVLLPTCVHARHGRLMNVVICKGGCGRISRFVREDESAREYLLANEVAEGELWQDEIGSLVVSERIAAHLRRGRMEKFECTPIEVLERPLDGLHMPWDPAFIEGADPMSIPPPAWIKSDIRTARQDGG